MNQKSSAATPLTCHVSKPARLGVALALGSTALTAQATVVPSYACQMLEHRDGSRCMPMR